MINHKLIPKLFYNQIQKKCWSTVGGFELTVGGKSD